MMHAPLDLLRLRPEHDQPDESWLQAPAAQPQLRMLLLQDPAESRVSNALAGEHLPLAQQVSSVSRMHRHASALRAGICLPVGSRDFLRGCMRAAGIDEPHWDSYPKALVSHMLGHPRKVAAGVALRWGKPVFVKPIVESPYFAFVLREHRDDMTHWEKAQLDRFMESPGADPVWISRVLPIAAKWRYYVLDGDVIGYAPSSPGASGVVPSIDEVSSIVAAAPPHGAFALDVAVLEDGTTTLLCVRDAWALEWFPFGPEALDPLEFVHFLWARWSDLLLTPRRIAANSSMI